ncbi:MAG TPA: hypothetical protein VN894_11355 [Polyangiaceae bacterium]|nr:hypothetical protein [Polyangiaceae bacterium]
MGLQSNDETSNRSDWESLLGRHPLILGWARACATTTMLGAIVACSSATESPSAPDAGPAWAEAGPDSPAEAAAESSGPDAGADAISDAAADAISDAAADAVSDAAADAVSLAGYPATHASLPTVETAGGPVLSAPNIIPIFFGGDSFQPQIEQFLSQLQGSSYWTATTSEYGVGALRVGSSIVVADAPPPSITPAGIASWLAGYLDGTHAEWPTNDGKNIYTVFYPASTTITQSNGTTSCTDFAGFHAEGFERGDAGGGADGGTTFVEAGGDAGVDANDDGATDDATVADSAIGDAASPDVASSDAASAVVAPLGTPFVFAVIPRCPTVQNLTGIDAVTLPISHEMIEAATDPFTQTSPAYYHVDFDHLAWDLYLDGSELADMCLAETSDRIARQLVGNFMVQRSWSNRAAELNEDPCVPSIADTYINGAPEFDEAVGVANPGNKNYPNLVTMGGRIPVGQSRTISVRLFATAPTTDWSVRAVEKIAPGASSTLAFSWSKLTGNNGDVLKLTISRTAAGTNGGTPIFLQSYRPTGVGQRVSGDLWLGVITD